MKNSKNHTDKFLSIPSHIAIIMDGNGRWAKSRNLSRIEGHREGVKTVRKITQYCGEIGVQKLTLYTFSSENWKRPKSEIKALMTLLVKTIRKEVTNLHENNVRFTTIGDIQNMPEKIYRELQEAMEETSENTGLNLNLAVNYGGRQEITEICKKLCEETLNGKISPTDVNESYFQSKIALDEYSDPDLLIRTGGELRISNFMLWQIAYTELYITDTYWPDFKEEKLIEAIEDFQKRERRFGKISEQV